MVSKEGWQLICALLAGEERVTPGACYALGCCFDAGASQSCIYPTSVEARALEDLVQQRREAPSPAAAEALAPSSAVTGQLPAGPYARRLCLPGIACESKWLGDNRGVSAAGRASAACRYAMPATGPEIRLGMSWGIGWLNLHNLLATNIAASDLGPVRLVGLRVRACLHSARFAGRELLCFLSTPPACGWCCASCCARKHVPCHERLVAYLMSVT